MVMLDWAAEAANITDYSTLVDSAFDVTNSFDLFTMKVACFHTIVEGDTLWSIATKIKKKEKLDIFYIDGEEEKVPVDVKLVSVPKADMNNIADIVAKIKGLNGLLNNGISIGKNLQIGETSIDVNDTITAAPSVPKPIQPNTRTKPYEIPQPKEEETEEKEKEVVSKGTIEILRGKLTASGENETGKNFKGSPEVPKETSGVTIGFGYDVKERNADEIREDLTSVGLNEAQIDIMIRAAGLNGSAAREFLNRTEDGQTQKNKEIFGSITEAVANDLLGRQLDVYESNRAKPRMTKFASYHFDADIKPLLTTEQWNQLDDTVKELIVDIDYHGMLAGASVFLEGEDDKGSIIKQTLVKALLDVIAPKTGNKRIVEESKIAIFKGLAVIFSHENIGYQIMQNAKPTIYYTNWVQGADKKDLDVKDNRYAGSFNFTGNPSDIIKSNPKWKLDRRTALRRCYIEFIATKLEEGYDVIITGKNSN